MDNECTLICVLIYILMHVCMYTLNYVHLIDSKLESYVMKVRGVVTEEPKTPGASDKINQQQSPSTVADPLDVRCFYFSSACFVDNLS